MSIFQATRPVAKWLLLLLLLTIACSSNVDVEQPIAFNHKLHVAELEIACTECHVGAEQLDHATIPAEELCLEMVLPISIVG